MDNHNPINPVIFISYLRNDSEKATSIYNFLAEHYPKNNIFFDKEKIEGGEEWKPKIYENIFLSTHFLVVITNRTVTEMNNRECFFLKEINCAMIKYASIDPDFNIIPVFADTAISDSLYPVEKLARFHGLEYKSKNAKNTKLKELQVKSYFDSFSKKAFNILHNKIESTSGNMIIYGPERVGKSEFFEYLTIQNKRYVKINASIFKDQFEKNVDKIKNPSSIILLDEFQNKFERCLGKLKDKRIILASKITNQNDIIKNFKEICIKDYEYMKFWNIDDVANNIFSNLIADSEKAKTVSIICGGRPQIVKEFFYRLQQNELLDDIVKDSIIFFSDYFQSLYSKYKTTEQISMIEGISLLISDSTEQKFELNQEVLRTKLVRLKKYVELIFIEHQILKSLQNDNLISWNPDKKEIRITFALFFFWVKDKKENE